MKDSESILLTKKKVTECIWFFFVNKVIVEWTDGPGWSEYCVTIYCEYCVTIYKGCRIWKTKLYWKKELYWKIPLLCFTKKESGKREKNLGNQASPTLILIIIF